MEKEAVTFTRNDTKVIKAIAIVLMFIHHLFFFPERIAEDITYIPLFSFGGNTIEYLIGQFGKICVMLFVFLSGYGTFWVCKDQSMRKISKVIAQKCKKLYFVYWQVFLIFIPICLLAGAETVPLDFEQFLWNFSGLKITYNGEWWFFTPFVVLLVAFPLIYRLSEKFQNVFTEFVTICAVNTFVVFVLPKLTKYQWGASLSNSLVYDLFVQGMRLLPGFLMGCMFAKHDLLSKIKRKFSGNILWCAVSLMLLFAVFYMRRKTNDNYDFVYAPLFTASVAVLLNNQAGAVIKRPLLWIGNESTIMWLTHSFYCYILCQRLIYLPRFAPLIVLWLLLISFVTAKAIKMIYKYLGKGYLKIQKIFIIKSKEL